MKKYIIYARVASRNQIDRSSSINSQIETLTAIADELNIEVTDVFTEFGSANKDRKAFNKMVNKLVNGEADGVLCMDLNRLCRKNSDFQVIKNLIDTKGIEIVTPGEVFNKDKEKIFVLSLLVAMDEYGRALRLQRIKSGKQKKVGKKMRKLITKPMFSYEHVSRTYDKFGNLVSKLAISPYCLGCLLENDGEEVALEVEEKYQIELFCKNHLERFIKLATSVNAKQ